MQEDMSIEQISQNHDKYREKLLAMKHKIQKFNRKSNNNSQSNTHTIIKKQQTHLKFQNNNQQNSNMQFDQPFNSTLFKNSSIFNENKSNIYNKVLQQQLHNYNNSNFSHIAIPQNYGLNLQTPSQNHSQLQQHNYQSNLGQHKHLNIDKQKSIVGKIDAVLQSLKKNSGNIPRMKNYLQDQPSNVSEQISNKASNLEDYSINTNLFQLKKIPKNSNKQKQKNQKSFHSSTSSELGKMSNLSLSGMPPTPNKQQIIDRNKLKTIQQQNRSNMNTLQMRKNINQTQQCHENTVQKHKAKLRQTISAYKEVKSDKTHRFDQQQSKRHQTSKDQDIINNISVDFQLSDQQDTATKHNKQNIQKQINQLTKERQSLMKQLKEIEQDIQNLENELAQ